MNLHLKYKLQQEETKENNKVRLKNNQKKKRKPNKKRNKMPLKIRKKSKEKAWIVWKNIKRLEGLQDPRQEVRQVIKHQVI